MATPREVTGYTGTKLEPVQQLDLAGLQEAIEDMARTTKQQAKALRSLFEAHGYDLANGDVLYHAPGVSIDVPPRYRAQVCASPLLTGGTVCFTRNPRFSLF